MVLASPSRTTSKARSTPSRGSASADFDSCVLLEVPFIGCSAGDVVSAVSCVGMRRVAAEADVVATAAEAAAERTKRSTWSCAPSSSVSQAQAQLMSENTKEKNPCSCHIDLLVELLFTRWDGSF